MRRDVALIANCIVTLVTVAACFNGDSAARPEEICATVRDRLVELELPSKLPDRDRRADVMRRALGSEFVDHCRQSLSQVQTDCVLVASDSRAAQRCLADASATTTVAKGAQ